jgi:hypothetical protein
MMSIFHDVQLTQKPGLMFDFAEETSFSCEILGTECSDIGSSLVRNSQGRPFVCDGDDSFDPTMLMFQPPPKPFVHDG